jgi:hypothetical protein
MKRHDIPIARLAITLTFALGVALATTAARAGEPRSVNETRPADPAGSVEIVNVASRVDVQGWDQPQIDVSGTIGDKVVRVDVSSSGNHASVRVVLPSGPQWGGDGSANLTVHVPRRSVLNVSLVSADMEVADLAGEGHLRTVSGDAELSLGALARGRFQSISGNLGIGSTLAPGGQIEAESVSGDISLCTKAPRPPKSP